MLIRDAARDDLNGIRQLYLQAFDESETVSVSNVAVNLLIDNCPEKVISLVAVNKNEVMGHVAFSPVFMADTGKHFAYILAPLAVLPNYQNNSIGSSLVRQGLDTISRSGTFVVFVYGDSQFYSRFGFTTDAADRFIPPYTLQYPQGWQALNLNSAVIPSGGKIQCVDALNQPELW